MRLCFNVYFGVANAKLCFVAILCYCAVCRVCSGVGSSCLCNGISTIDKCELVVFEAQPLRFCDMIYSMDGGCQDMTG